MLIKPRNKRYRLRTRVYGYRKSVKVTEVPRTHMVYVNITKATPEEREKWMKIGREAAERRRQWEEEQAEIKRKERIEKEEKRIEEARQREIRRAEQVKELKKQLSSQRTSIGMITKRQKNKLTSSRDGEHGGYLNFEKKDGKTYFAGFSNLKGKKDEIDLNKCSKDKEFMWHSHPLNDWTIFSSDDMKGIMENKNQQGEVLFRGKEAIAITKPKSLNTNKFLKEYSETLQSALDNHEPQKKAIPKLVKVLKKHKFQVGQFKPNQTIKVKINKAN